MKTKLVMGLALLLTASAMGTYPIYTPSWDKYCTDSASVYRVWIDTDISNPQARLEHFGRTGIFGGRLYLRDSLTMSGAFASGSRGDFYTFSGRSKWNWSVSYDHSSATVHANGGFMGTLRCQNY